MASPTEQECCPVCNLPAAWNSKDGGAWAIACPKCGNFDIGWIAAKTSKQFSAIQAANLSGWIRENQGVAITESVLKNLANLRTLTVGEKAEKILVRLAQKFPKPGERLDLSGGVHLEFLAIGRAVDNDELRFLMREFLHEEMGLLLMHVIGSGLGADENYKISPKGWAYLESLRHGNSDSQIGFIAMWFDKSVDPAWTAIEAGIRNSGYEPLRIDRKEHNNKIDDEIVAGIRRSKFLVADFTGHRGGVYFETGFATGLGLPVIWLCRQDELEKTHFDTRQYNFIVWETEKLAELSKTLQNRIEATIGRGPLTGNALL
jgi:nucleoside 2-deoxyribosyltransferase